MKNMEWIKCSDRLPDYKDIDENKSDTFWGYFMNQSGDTYVDLVGWNRSMNIFETGNDEIVLYWGKLTIPDPPERLTTGKFGEKNKVVNEERDGENENE